MATSFSSSSSCSSSSSHVIHPIFPSFHGPDVRRGFLSHLRHVFAKKEITMFKDDQDIERGHTIRSELIQAIREARASIVLLSKNYASSSWCLDELLEILKCKEDSGQIVMPIFYDVEPWDVRNQKGDFGIAFEKTCEGETEEKKRSWIDALTCVATIAGEHSRNWTDEAVVVEKISTVMLNKLKVEEIKDIFRSCDVDQNGFVTAPELKYVLTKDGDKFTDEAVCSIIQKYDVDGDARISFDEFVKIYSEVNELSAICKKLVTDVSLPREEIQEMMATFKTLDVDQNGFITAADIQLSMKNYGEKEEAYEFIRSCDVNGDGRVSFDEYVKYMMARPDEKAAMAKKLVTDVTLSKEEMQKMMATFKTYDVDHNGYITPAEFQWYNMQNTGKQVTDEESGADTCPWIRPCEEAYEFIRSRDVDGDGRISFDEFVKYMMASADEKAPMVKELVTDVKLSKEEMQEMMATFMVLDADHNGSITPEEFQRYMKKTGKEATFDEVFNWIRTFDVDGDFRVNFDEFVKKMVNIRRGNEKAPMIEKYVFQKLNRFIKFMVKALS